MPSLWSDLAGAAVGFATGGPVGAVAGGLGTALSGNSSATQASNAAQSATDAQNQLIQQGLLPIYQSMLNDYNTNYQPLEAGISSDFSGLNNTYGANASDINNNFSNLINAYASPTNTAAATGVPLPSVVNQALQYYTNPGGTLGGLNSVGGQVLNYQLGEGQNGLDPSILSNALQAQNSTFGNNVNTLRNSIGASLNNPQGTVNDLMGQNDLAQGNLLSNFAAQDQNFKNQGMNSALQTAGGIDTQTSNMLTQGYNLANSQSQQDLGNMALGGTTAQNVLDLLQNYIGQGKTILPGLASGYSSLAGQYGSAASTAATNAANLSATQGNPFSTALTSLASGNGLSNLSSILGGLGGSGGNPDTFSSW